jgi:sulfonate transport system permease protein
MASDRRELSSTLIRWSVGAAAVGALMGVWEVAARTGAIQSALLPPPSVVLPRLLELLIDGELVRQTAVTLERIGLALAISIVIALALAAACAASRWIRWATTPIVEFIRGMAPLALLPAFILILGIGLASNVGITVWVTWVPIFISTLEGFDRVDPEFVRVARVFGASRKDILLSISLPSCVPFFLTGLRLGIGSAFLVVVAAELIGSPDGLGYYILHSSQTFKISDMYAAIILIGLLGLTINGSFSLLKRAIAPWNES